MTGALVLFSGGQDSATCLAWALARFDCVETIGFDYGQRHRAELACREAIRQTIFLDDPVRRRRLGCDHMLALPVLGDISETALTREADILMNETGLPNTFVPGRNLLFLTLAGAVAYRRNLAHLVAGVCETDYSGYPDCRDATMKAMQQALNLGMEAHFVIDTPLMALDKAQTWRLAFDLGGDQLVELVREASHSCYLGERGRRHEWGYGCGACPACELRARGWMGYKRGEESSAAAL